MRDGQDNVINAVGRALGGGTWDDEPNSERVWESVAARLAVRSRRRMVRRAAAAGFVGGIVFAAAAGAASRVARVYFLRVFTSEGVRLEEVPADARDRARVEFQAIGGGSTVITITPDMANSERVIDGFEWSVEGSRVAGTPGAMEPVKPIDEEKRP